MQMWDASGSCLNQRVKAWKSIFYGPNRKTKDFKLFCVSQSHVCNVISSVFSGLGFTVKHQMKDAVWIGVVDFTRERVCVWEGFGNMYVCMTEFDGPGNRYDPLWSKQLCEPFNQLSNYLVCWWLWLIPVAAMLITSSLHSLGYVEQHIMTCLYHVHWC